jgi:hypothetical protein
MKDRTLKASISQCLWTTGRTLRINFHHDASMIKELIILLRINAIFYPAFNIV